MTCLAGLARVYARRGDPAAAELAADALAQAGELAMPWFEAAALHAQGDLAWGRGALPEAVGAFEAKLRVMEDDGIRDTDLSPLPELVELLVQLERRDEAAALAARYAGEAGVKGGRVGARARPPGRRAGRRGRGRAPLRRGARAARRRRGRVRARPHRALPRRAPAPHRPPHRRT